MWIRIPAAALEADETLPPSGHRLEGRDDAGVVRHVDQESVGRNEDTLAFSDLDKTSD